MKIGRGLTMLMAACVVGGCTTIPAGPAITQAGACPSGATETRHTLGTPQAAMNYSACVGTITVTGEDGAPLADLVYTAYLHSDRNTDRPLVFVWNGGPGADSRLLHFEALGPRVLDNGRLVDNPDSPLPIADLVFLDPAGTGFSRARGEQAEQALYSTMGDIAATAQFIERFRAAAGRTASPIFLAGESFGTWRAAGTAEALIDKGIDVDGVLLISGGIPIGEATDEERARARALSLPNRTATAIALVRIPADRMASAEDWARTIWLPALLHPDRLDEAARDTVVAGLSHYTGVDENLIDSESLWMSPRDFREKLLASEGKVLDVFDMRQVVSEGDDDANGRAILAYYRGALAWSGGRYAGLEEEALPVGRQWQYDQAPITEASLARAMAGEGPPSPSRPWISQALDKHPRLRVFVATGLYDSLNACAATEDTIARLPPVQRGRFEYQCYRGGHMMYDAAEQARKFGQDVSRFISSRSPPL